ncbi:MAG TPA: DUF4382 domain-containing protein [Bacteroidales bacterium]|nr:DUF4382 domain-containing protein [Bacteroidales bacterium]HRR93647.1 DUF4382 domain-containing protein [Bacteroidales bacterium]HRT90062.1 DUF4382 domain-containing protein [Bacteroidales bacterium]
MKKIVVFAGALALLISACTKTENETGRLIVKVTDDPFNISYVESATVTITKIELKRAGHNYTPGENPFIVLSEDTITLDLINLRNGITKELLDLEIPAGTYDQLRLYVDNAGLKIREQNSPFHCKVPGGPQTGIKIFIRPALVVGGGLTSELLLDFDLSRSFVMLGNLNHHLGVNGFIFKPVIRAVNNSSAGRVEGFVSDTSKVKLANAKVWLTRDTVITTAFTDTLGYYAMIGIPAGTYSVFATKENYDTVSYKDINVVAANRTVVNFSLTRK